ncbi:MAG: biosynthetic-type acetolactate synthase large subunit [Actinobacteria bacterium]|nr:biosynthetic-type acetolactate synthase large subunit [Actinomycetota bacterium]
MRITGAEALIKSLEHEGVEVIFGYPGGVVLPIYDAIYDSKICHILVRHEQCAAHAADGYARATGKVGVCMATSGPGATNLVTGIANAYMDSVPMVAITGQVGTHVIGTDAFQEADITGITSPITKHNYLIKNVEDLPRIIKEAFYIARTGRPGPVLIDIPVDVSKGELDYKYPTEVNLPGYKPTIKGNARQIKQAAQAIIEAKEPIIFAGGGILKSNAEKELHELAELTGIYVTTTLMGKGAFDETHPLSLGMPGMHGARYVNYAMTETDLIIAVGVRFDDRVTGKLSEFARKAKIIHIDIDPAEIGKNVFVHIPIVGDTKNVLSSLAGAIKKILEEEKMSDRSDWNKKIEEWKKKYPLKYHHNNKLKPEFIIEQIYNLTKDKNTIITTGVGQNQMWSAQYYKARKPGTFISSGGLGTMGFGMPAAIGAQVGCPDALVFDIDGDGSFQMVSQDLVTAVCNQLPIKIAILNNGYLGMVRQWQELFYNRHYSNSCLMRDKSCPPQCTGPTEACPKYYLPDFVKLAEAYGAVGLRITKPEEVEPAVKKAIETPLPVVMDFIIEREENVFPMVAPGAPVDQMIGGD